MGRFIKLEQFETVTFVYLRADRIQGISESTEYAKISTYIDVFGESGWYVKETVSEVMDLVNQSLLEMTDA